MRARERQLSDRYRRESDQAIAAHLTAMPEYQAAGTIFCFVGTPHEIDTRPILENALAAGKRLCVPLCTGPGMMELRQITTLSQLSPGAYGIPEPPEDAPLSPWMRQILPSSPASPATIWATVLGKVRDITTVFWLTTAAVLCCSAGKSSFGRRSLWSPMIIPFPGC